MLAALADETRWQILVRIGDAPASASALADALPISRQAIVKHLKVLEAEGLVMSERRGRAIEYRALGAQLSALARSLDAVGRAWEMRLEGVKAEIERSRADGL